MLFIETSIFTRLAKDILSDDLYHLLQVFLATYPDSGRIIEESGGLRKLRWKFETSGKRGGVRLIYYFNQSNDTIYMIYIYKKSQTDKLTKSQVIQLKNLVKGLKE
jgi:mRNA-degrading endonuclease RelE of RelBE toxin-antitoxin system